MNTMKDLMEKVKEFAEKDDEIYSEKSVGRKLKEKYNNHIFLTDIPERESVISFKEMVSYVLLEKKKQKAESKESIIIAAAKIIKEGLSLRELRRAQSSVSKGIGSQKSSITFEVLNPIKHEAT